MILMIFINERFFCGLICRVGESTITNNNKSAIPSNTSGLIEIPTILGGYPVVGIGRGAFRECNRINSVIIPDSVTNIYPEGNPWISCQQLTSLVVDENNTNYKSINGMLLSKDETTLLCVPGGLSSVTIPNSVINIGKWAFTHCTNLESILIPNNIINI